MRASVRAAATLTSRPGDSARAVVTPCLAEAVLPNSASCRAALTCHKAAVSLESVRAAESTARREKSRALPIRP